MQVRFHCPTDRCVAIIEYEPIESSSPSLECPRCRRTHKLKVTESMRRDHVVDQCAACGGKELFIRKDFPQKVGVGVVVVFGLIALYFFRLDRVVVAWSVLAAAALLDLVIYCFIGKVTTCYGCRAEYRKCSLNPAHEGFDLATAEKY